MSCLFFLTKTYIYWGVIRQNVFETYTDVGMDISMWSIMTTLIGRCMQLEGVLIQPSIVKAIDFSLLMISSTRRYISFNLLKKKYIYSISSLLVFETRVLKKQSLGQCTFYPSQTSLGMLL